MALPPGRCFKSRAIPRHGFARVDVRFTFIATLSASARRTQTSRPAPVSRAPRVSAGFFFLLPLPSAVPSASAAAAAAATPRLRLAPESGVAAAAAASSVRPPRRPTPPPPRENRRQTRGVTRVFFFFSSPQRAPLPFPAPGRDDPQDAVGAFRDAKMTPFAPRKPPCHLSGSSERVPTSEHSFVSGSMRSTDGVARDGVQRTVRGEHGTLPLVLYVRPQRLSR